MANSEHDAMTSETARERFEKKFGKRPDHHVSGYHAMDEWDAQLEGFEFGWQAALSTQPQPNDETLEKIADEIQNSIGDGFGSAEEFRVILKILEKHFLQEPVPAPPAKPQEGK